MQAPLETAVPAALEPGLAHRAQGVAPKKKGRVYTRTSHAPSQEFKDLKERYMAWMRATRYAATTLEGASSDVEAFFRFLKKENVLRIADVTKELINDYSLTLRNAAAPMEGNYVNLANAVHRLSGLKRFFRWAEQNMIVLLDPAESIELPKLPQSLPRGIITQEEARRLLDASDLQSPVGYRDKALIEVVYSTGIRTAELLKLKVADFDAKQRTLTVRQGKGNKDRILPLPAVSAGYLAEYIAKIRPKFVKARGWRGDDGTMFLNYTGGYCVNSDLKVIFTRAKKAARIDKTVTAMTLRHSIASHLLENGVDVAYIKEFLGHEKLTTTQLYTKVTLSGLRKHYNKHHPREKRVRSLAA